MSKKRESIDLKTKYEILQDIEKGVNYKTIMNNYSLKNRQNISQIKSQKKTIEKAFESHIFSSNRKKLKKAKFEDIDNKVMVSKTKKRKYQYKWSYYTRSGQTIRKRFRY